MMASRVVAGLILAGTVLNASAQSRDGLIQDAIRNGAHVIQCNNNVCQDMTSMTPVGHSGKAPDGTYLVYPDTPDSTGAITRTQQQARELGY